MDGDREYLARTWLADPEHGTGGGGTTKKQPPWNGIDFFVAVGENDHRNWDDMRRYGFVSADHGDKYRRAMKKPLRRRPRSRRHSWHRLRRRREVVDGAVRVNDFLVEHNCSHTPILQAPLEASDVGR